MASAHQSCGLTNFQNLFDDRVLVGADNNFIWTVIFLTVPVVSLGHGCGPPDAPERPHCGSVVIFLPRIIAVAVTGRIFQGMIFSPRQGDRLVERARVSLSDPL
jgi:raffinose/stachyose/melibiose transport system permease protein